MIQLPAEAVRTQFCYLITTGRVSGKTHEVEMWFAAHPSDALPSTIYCLSGGRDRSDWVLNIRAHPAMRVRINGTTYAAQGEIVEGATEDPRAREALSAKYYNWREGPLPNSWARESLPVAIRLESEG